MKQLSVRIPNKVGALADVCERLGGAGINMEGISGQGENEHGVVRVITADELSARKALEKGGYEVTVADVMTFKVPNRPGELGKAARRLAKSGVNIDCIYLLGKDRDTAEFAVTTSHLKQAMSALK